MGKPTRSSARLREGVRGSARHLWFSEPLLGGEAYDSSGTGLDPQRGISPGPGYLRKVHLSSACLSPPEDTLSFSGSSP